MSIKSSLISLENKMLAMVDTIEANIQEANESIESHEYEWRDTAKGQKAQEKIDSLEVALDLINEALERIQEAQDNF